MSLSTLKKYIYKSGFTLLSFSSNDLIKQNELAKETITNTCLEPGSVSP